MPSKLFSAEHVSYGAAPFTKVQLGYNSRAKCLNLIVPGSTKGALQVVGGFGDPEGPQVSLDGETCTIGSAVTARFINEAVAAEFATCLGFAPPAKVPETVPESAPCTPPARAAKSTVAMSSTPPRVKRAKLAEIMEEPVEKKKA
eukprot:gb/GFBE01062890.1/.p1 GENE.gb/GFBE01062890.1/~~gb/GFBE01062890.1/.p1  ORF type:complete len:145 (+),score=44.12 gb/GFBE01062890.1/:1-435(+)